MNIEKKKERGERERGKKKQRQLEKLFLSHSTQYILRALHKTSHVTPVPCVPRRRIHKTLNG